MNINNIVESHDYFPLPVPEKPKDKEKENIKSSELGNS